MRWTTCSEGELKNRHTLIADPTLIFPFQPFNLNPVVSKARTVVLIEEGLVFGDPHVGLRHHQQKIVLHRASMKTYAAALERRGLDVR